MSMKINILKICMLTLNTVGLIPVKSKLQHPHRRESTKHGPLVHGPPPWTWSMDRVHQNMDRVHEPPFMDRVHGPPYHGPGLWTPYFTSCGCTINYDLMTFDDTLRDGSSFGKPCTSLIAHLPWKLMFNSSFSLLLVILKHTGWFWKV